MQHFCNTKAATNLCNSLKIREYRQWDLNPHEQSSTDFKSVASTDSAMSASLGRAVSSGRDREKSTLVVGERCLSFAALFPTIFHP